MTKKAHKRSNPAKEVTKRIETEGSARSPGNAPSIPDLTAALAAAMAELKAAQLSRLLGNATVAALPGESVAGQAKAGKKKAGKAREEARKQDRRSGRQAERETRRAAKQARREARQAGKQSGKEAMEARPASDADAQVRHPRGGLRAVA